MAEVDPKDLAVEFLKTTAAGRAQAEMDRFVAPGCVHHNAYFPAGMGALAQAMDQAAIDHPRKSLEIKHVIGEGDMVAVHSRFRRDPDDRGFAVVHIFRFEGGRIAEFWDFGQEVPEDMPNADGMF